MECADNFGFEFPCLIRGESINEVLDSVNHSGYSPSVPIDYISNGIQCRALVPGRIVEVVYYGSNTKKNISYQEFKKLGNPIEI